MDKLKAYVIVRRDLSKSQQTVQTGHALVELAFGAGSRRDKNFKKWVEEDKTLVVLGANSLQHLKDIHDYVESRFIHRMFYEPDLDNEPTALAIYPGFGWDLDNHFRDLKLA